MSIVMRLGRPVAGEQGMAMISALLLILIVSLMAVGMSMDSSMDVRLAAYQRFKASALSFAESGIMAATDILEENYADVEWTNPNPGTPFQFPSLSPNYVGRADGKKLDIVDNGSTSGVLYMESNVNENVTMQMFGDIQTEIVIQKVGTQHCVGGTLEFPCTTFNFMAEGTDAGQANSIIGLYYRHINR